MQERARHFQLYEGRNGQLAKYESRLELRGWEKLREPRDVPDKALHLLQSARPLRSPLEVLKSVF